MQDPTNEQGKIQKDYILKVNNLRTEFHTERGIVTAIDDISFTLKKGETIGIVGESGSGKSVTALSILQLLPQPIGKITHGQILFNHPTKGEIDLRKLSKYEMQEERGNSISMIFQEPMTSLNPVFTCGTQVMESLIEHQKLSIKEAKIKTIELFNKVQLPRPEAIFDSYPHQISGGQKQRVMIAIAMACKPSVLIADEPTTALDVTVQARTLQLMKQLRDENDMAIMFITHDLGVVAEIADWVIVMYQGQIVEQGNVFDIFNNPQHPYTKGLLACRPQIDKSMHTLPTVADFMSVEADGSFVEKTDAYHSITEAYEKNAISTSSAIAHHRALLEATPQLQIKNLSVVFNNKQGFFGKQYEKVVAVDNVSFEVYPGETIGLVGESGCGKTTLGRSIMRLAEPTEGEIIFENRSIHSLEGKELRKLRKDIQIIFQDPYSSLNPRLTIGESILEPMRVHKMYDSEFVRRKKAMEILEHVNLSYKFFNRYPHEFSGGQRQRICIARALAVNPKFIICDESVSALDVSVQAQVLNLLNQLKKDFKLTYIFISHDLSVVKFMADRMIVMNKGKIEEIGFSEEIYQNPKTDYTKKLIASIPKVDLDLLHTNQQIRRGLHV